VYGYWILGELPTRERASLIRWRLGAYSFPVNQIIVVGPSLQKVLVMSRATRMNLQSPDPSAICPTSAPNFATTQWKRPVVLPSPRIFQRRT